MNLAHKTNNRADASLVDIRPSASKIRDRLLVVDGGGSNKFNQGVTPTMRAEDAQLHWYFRIKEMGY